MQLTVLTTDEIRSAVRLELSSFFSNYNLQPQTEQDEIGKGAEFASKITGKAVSTIYDLVHKRLIPHSKRGKDLYFSRDELITWLKSGKRKNTKELAADAANYSRISTKQSR